MSNNFADSAESNNFAWDDDNDNALGDITELDDFAPAAVPKPRFPPAIEAAQRARNERIAEWAWREAELQEELTKAQTDENEARQLAREMNRAAAIQAQLNATPKTTNRKQLGKGGVKNAAALAEESIDIHRMARARSAELEQELAEFYAFMDKGLTPAEAAALRNRKRMRERDEEEEMTVPRGFGKKSGGKQHRKKLPSINEEEEDDEEEDDEEWDNGRMQKYARGQRNEQLRANRERDAMELEDTRTQSHKAAEANHSMDPHNPNASKEYIIASILNRTYGFGGWSQVERRPYYKQTREQLLKALDRVVAQRPGKHAPGADQVAASLEAAQKQKRSDAAKKAAETKAAMTAGKSKSEIAEMRAMAQADVDSRKANRMWKAEAAKKAKEAKAILAALEKEAKSKDAAARKTDKAKKAGERAGAKSTAAKEAAELARVLGDKKRQREEAAEREYQQSKVAKTTPIDTTVVDFEEMMEDMDQAQYHREGSQAAEYVQGWAADVRKSLRAGAPGAVRAQLREVREDMEDVLANAPYRFESAFVESVRKWMKELEKASRN